MFIFFNHWKHPLSIWKYLHKKCKVLSIKKLLISKPLHNISCVHLSKIMSAFQIFSGENAINPSRLTKEKVSQSQKKSYHVYLQHLLELLVGGRFAGNLQLKRKLMSLSHCQELGQLAYWASDWLFTLVQPAEASLLVDTTLDNDYNL